MSIAYIIDSSTEMTSLIRNQENVFVVPFKGYDSEGDLQNVSNSKKIRNLIETSKDGLKRYIEPTPGIYRDLFMTLQNEGYEYVVCIPQNQNHSKSFVNAEYASRFLKDFVIVIDSNEYHQEPQTIITHLLEERAIKDDSYFLELDFDKFIEIIRSLINKAKLVTI